MLEKEQELLKKVYDRKNVLVGGSCSIWKGLMDYSGRKQSISQPSFLSTDWIDRQVSFNY